MMRVVKHMLHTADELKQDGIKTLKVMTSRRTRKLDVTLARISLLAKTLALARFLVFDSFPSCEVDGECNDYHLVIASLNT